MRTSENSVRAKFVERSFRNCLENSWTSLDRVFLVSQSGDKGALQPVFPTHRTSEWSPSGFSKQFRKGNSRKSTSRILHSPIPNGPGALRRNGASPWV